MTLGEKSLATLGDPTQLSGVPVWCSTNWAKSDKSIFCLCLKGKGAGTDHEYVINSGRDTSWAVWWFMPGRWDRCLVHQVTVWPFAHLQWHDVSASFQEPLWDLTVQDLSLAIQKVRHSASKAKYTVDLEGNFNYELHPSAAISSDMFSMLKYM